MDATAVEKKLIHIIRDILADDAIEIDPEKSLMLDYGLDSLDLLDFAFNIEETFGVKIGANELRGKADGNLSEEEIFDEDGNFSTLALEALKKRIPEIPPEKFKPGLRQEDIPTLLNIKVFTRLVLDKEG